MLKIVLFLSVFLLSSAVAYEKGVEQKQIKTMQDFIDLEKTLKMTRMLDPVKANYYLGLLYLSEHKLDNGSVIQPDYDKALSFLERSLDGGNVLAAYNMAMIFLRKGKIDDSIFVLDSTIRTLRGGGKKDISAAAYLSASLASIVLDFKGGNQEAITLAISHLSRYTKAKSMPSGNYLLSQLYLRRGDIDLANRELTLACTSEKAPEKIKRICKKMQQR